MAIFVALLRAVNVGGTGKLDSKKLKAACEAAGLGRVSTYIQSGNVVFESAKSAGAVKALIEAILRDDFGLQTRCIVRSAAQIATVVEANPFADAASERPSLLLVMFLDGLPMDGAAAYLAAYKGPERSHLSGDALYIDYVNGVGGSKLTPAFLERALKVPGTARNWNTVNRLLEMARALEV